MHGLTVQGFGLRHAAVRGGEQLIQQHPGVARAGLELELAIEHAHVLMPRGQRSRAILVGSVRESAPGFASKVGALFLRIDLVVLLVGGLLAVLPTARVWLAVHLGSLLPSINPEGGVCSRLIGTHRLLLFGAVGVWLCAALGVWLCGVVSRGKWAAGHEPARVMPGLAVDADRGVSVAGLARLHGALVVVGG